MTYSAVAEVVWSGPERRARVLLAAENKNLAYDLAVAQVHPSPPNLVDYIGRPHAGVAW